MDGARMSYHLVDDYGNTMGFSLRPPKWLRKAQPGKILAKAAVPIGVVAGSLLIPGVGSALVGALTAGGGAVARGMMSLGKTAFQVLKPGLTQTSPISTIAKTAQILGPQLPFGIPNQVPQDLSSPVMPGAVPGIPQGPSVQSGNQPGGETMTAPGETPSWVLPVAIGGAALLIFSSMGRRR
jgi:hypothetical protein